ncbi:hypothetical protein MAR_024636 [Mya arenaria]|uniref:Uncharacterized protein n=1 Tax=Mya arenaria TaxID=6604 RepID=A0ABY7DT52_MYAAR|nr:hypothetical protein MAR_024636 [Mya arenaria]
MRNAVPRIFTDFGIDRWGVFGSDCCSSYTDPSGTYHASQLCQDYCCWNLDLTNYKVCCSNPIRQVPSSDRDQQSCTESWITEHLGANCVRSGVPGPDRVVLLLLLWLLLLSERPHRICPIRRSASNNRCGGQPDKHDAKQILIVETLPTHLPFIQVPYIQNSANTFQMNFRIYVRQLDDFITQT